MIFYYTIHKSLLGPVYCLDDNVDNCCFAFSRAVSRLSSTESQRFVSAASAACLCGLKVYHIYVVSMPWPVVPRSGTNTGFDDLFKSGLRYVTKNCDLSSYGIFSGFRPVYIDSSSKRYFLLMFLVLLCNSFIKIITVYCLA